MTPLILLFSPQARIREILVAGLVQCDFRVVETASPYLAVINAAKYPVDLLLVDLPLSDPRGMMIIRAFGKSKLLREKPILILVPQEPKDLLDKLFDEYIDKDDSSGFVKPAVITYPFNFAELVNKANELVGREIDPALKPA